MSNPRIPRKPGQPANSKKHSDLYTDENPKGTIHGLGFKDVATAKASVSKIRNSSRSHAHKIQAAVAMEQRAREMGKTSEAAVYRKYINAMKKKTKEMNEEKKNGRCPEGQYYCYTDEKCKPIPKGFKVVGRAGMLRKENGHSVDEPKNGNGNGNGNGGNTNGNGNGGNGGNGMSEETKKDHEYSMARSELKTVMNAAKRLNKKMGKKGEGELKAWVQSKITKAADYIDTAADYVTNEETVSEEGLRDWFGKSKSKDGKSGWVNVVTGDSCASDKPGEGIPKCVSSAKRASMSKKERKAAAAAKRREDPGQQQKTGAAKPTMVKTDRKVRKEDMDINEAKDKKGKGSGTKDACYHKVKSRYSVWPSAYASGALVKCRKVGAANWGNSSKNEEFMALPEFSDIQINAMRKAGIEVEVIDEKCWKGYEKKGMKTMFGKRYPNCVKKEEVTGGILVQDKDDFKPREIETVDIIKPEPIKGGQLNELQRTKMQTGNMYQVIFGWRGKMMMVKLFFPDASIPTRQKVAAALDKMYPGSQLRSYSHSIVDYDDPYINVGEETVHESVCEKCGQSPCVCTKEEYHSDWRSEVSEDWQSVNRKDKTDGLSQKAVDAYRRENPGSKLKTAVTTKPSKLKKGSKDANRRKSFCSRMKGMKKRLTSAKTARDPDSRINKALRRWNC